MANAPGINGGLDDWDPGQGGAENISKSAALMNTEAKDNPDSINATNKLERFRGKAKTPSGPFGTQGQEF